MHDALTRSRKMGLHWKLALLPFRSALLREAALRSSRDLYQAGRWLGSGWRAPVLLVLAVAAVWWGWSALLRPEPVHLVDLLKPNTVARMLVAASLLAIVRWALRTRRYVVIAGFEDYTGDDRNKATIKGLSALLLEEMERIAELYRTIDEGWPDPVGGKGEIIEATAMVDQIGDDLRGAISATSEVRLGPLKIPLGALLLPVSRVLKGPRISGSVHLEGDQPILLAHFEGRRNFQWSVLPSAVEDAGASSTALLSRMVEQLAYRVFTDLVPIGSSRWKAVQFYTLGLRHWRSTIGTEKDRRLRLHRAEAAFITALAEDNDFARCHYNLGVVYRDLGDNNAAIAAYMQAVKADPEQVDAWYALAVKHSERELFDDALQLCDRAISINPDDPRLWNLYGLAQRRAEDKRRGYAYSASEAASELWDRILCKRATAVALAWKALARASLRARRESRARAMAAICTANLAIAYGQRGRERRAETAFRQALLLDPNAAHVHLNLGAFRLYYKHWSDAVRAVERAVRFGDSPEAWMRLAVAHAWASLAGSEEQREHHRAATREACRHAFDDSSHLSPELLQDAQDAYRAIDEQAGVNYMQVLEKLLAPDEHEQNAFARRTNESLAEFEERMSALTRLHPGRDWLRAQAEIRLAEEKRESDVRAATRHLHEAIRLLGDNHLQEIRGRGLFVLLSRTYLKQDKLMEALKYAQRAVSLQPERAWERRNLGDVYLYLHDCDRAEREFRISLALEPNEMTLIQITLTFWKRGLTILDPVRRRSWFERVIKGLSELLEQEPSERGWAHYWLGQFHEELLQYDDAIYHLKAAQRMGFKPLEAQVDIAWTYMRAHAWSDAEEAVCDALSEARRQLRLTHSSQRPADADGEDVPINQNLVEVWMALAFCWANRETNLKRAAHLTRLAARRIERITPSRERSRFRARLADCHGWIRCKQGALDDATNDLEQSVALFADGGAYYRLARVYLARAADAVPREAWISKARRACGQARENDLNGEYERDISTVEQELMALSPPSMPRPMWLA